MDEKTIGSNRLIDGEALEQLSNLPDSSSNQAIAKENGVIINKDIGGASDLSLGELNDVSLTLPQNGQVITYNSTSEEWENQTLPGGGDMLSSVYDPTSVSGDAFNQDNMNDGINNKNYTVTDKTKLDGIESNAEVNNISDVNAVDLTDGGDSTLHFHSSDRDRTNHTGTQSADTIVDGTINKVLTAQQKQYYTNLTSTSIITGFTITINSSTTVDISAGEGVVVDNYTDPLNPVVYPVSFTGATNVSVNNLANGVTYFSIDKDGNIVQSPNEPERQNLRDAFVIGAVVSPDGATISSIDEYTFAHSLDVALNLDDFITAIGGLINPEGNVYFRGTTNPLGLNKTAGQIFWFGANYKNNRKDPNYLNTPALTDLSFVTVWRDGLGGFNTGALTTSITTGVYDDGTGGATQPNGNLPNQRFANHRLYYDGSSDLTVLQYGQEFHNNLDDAVVSASTENFEKDPRLNGLMFRGWLTVRGNVNDLGDASRAKFTPGGFFQDVGGGALANIPDNLQGGYNNSSAGEIVTNATNGALTIQQGSGLDTDFVYEGRNGAGTNTFTVSGEGNVEANEYNGVPLTSGGAGNNYLSDDGTYKDTPVESDPTGVTGADQVTNIMSLTQAEYDAIVTPNTSTFYIIT